MLGPGIRFASIRLLTFKSVYGSRLPGRTHRGYASRQIESRRGVRDLGNEQSWLTNLSIGNLHGVRIGVVKVVMHSNQAGDNGVAGAIQMLCVLRDLDGRSRADGLDLAIRDHDRLVFLRCCARPIDDSDVLKNEDGRIDSYKGATSLDFWVWASAIAAMNIDPHSNRRRIRTPRKTVVENRQAAWILPQCVDASDCDGWK